MCLPKADGSCETGKLIISQKRRSFPLEITAERGLWYGLIIVCTTPFCKEGSWASNHIFKKGVLTRTQHLQKVAGKEGGGIFFKGSCNFLIKNKLKSKIFNDEKSLEEKKKFFFVITKNSNWEISPKNLVTFKR